MTDEQKLEKLIMAKQYVRNCLLLNSPDDLRAEVLSVILPWAEYWKIHDYVEWVKTKWDKLRRDY